MSEREDKYLTPEEQELQNAVRGLGEVQADADFRARLRQQFVSGAIETAASAEPGGENGRVVELPRRPRRRRWGALVAVAAALAVVFLMQDDVTWQLQAVRGEGTVAVNGHSVPTADQQALAELIAPAARITVPEGVEIDAVLDDVMVVGVSGPADFTLPPEPDQAAGAYLFVVSAGEFRIKTGPDFPGREAIMQTTEGKVDITGTTVAVFKNVELTCVCVLEGTAMIGRDDDHMDPIPAGMRKVMFADGREPMIVTIEPNHKKSLLEFETYNQDTFK